MISKFKNLSPLTSGGYGHFFFLCLKKLQGALIFRGNRNLAYKLLCKIKYNLKMREFIDPLYTLLVGFVSLIPSFINYSLRVGATKRILPFPLSQKKQIIFVVKYLVKHLRQSTKHNRFLPTAFASLVIDSILKKGVLKEKRDTQNRVSIENRYLLRKVFK